MGKDFEDDFDNSLLPASEILSNKILPGEGIAQNKANSVMQDILSCLCAGEISLRKMLDYISEAEPYRQSMMVSMAVAWLKLASDKYRKGDFDCYNEYDMKLAESIVTACGEAGIKL